MLKVYISDTEKAFICVEKVDHLEFNLDTVELWTWVDDTKSYAINIIPVSRLITVFPM